MTKLKLQVQNRKYIGKKVKNLRKEGLLPGVVYGQGLEALNIQIDTKEFQAVYTEAGESTLVYLSVGDTEHPTIIVDVDLDPITDSPRHVDFHIVNLKEKIIAMIPLVFIGESPAVKNFNGILVKNMQEVQVEGLPQNLPHEISVDISGLLELESNILVKQLISDKNIKVLAHEDDIVVLVQVPMSDEEFEKSLEGSQLTVEDVEIEQKKPEEIVDVEEEEKKV